MSPYVIEFAYVMTGPHLDEEGGDATGIPFAYRRSIDALSPIARSHSPSVSHSARKNKGKAKSAEHGSSKMRLELEIHKFCSL